MKPIIERAFELARSGEYPWVKDLVPRLKREGYFSADVELDGRVIRDQLRTLIKLAARNKSPEK